MNKIELKVEIWTYDFDELTEEVKNLIDMAKMACDISHSPYSKFRVGCAVRLSNGHIVRGANQENAAYPICLCAEGVTLASVASQYPNEKIVDVAVYVPIESPASPCGFCRQSFKEYEVRMNSTFQYFLAGKGQVYAFKGIDTILPLAFSPKDLIDFNRLEN